MSNLLEIKWKQGARFSIDPEEAHACIEKVRLKKGGSIEAADVVAEAKKKTSPLHPEFEWDDKVAAHQHRLHRARVMMASVVVVREEAPDVESRQYEVRVKTRAEADAAGEPVRVFQTTEQILEDPVQRDRFLARAFAELASFRSRYAGLSELAQVFTAIEDLGKVA
jgi:hypothetical protein